MRVLVATSILSLGAVLGFAASRAANADFATPSRVAALPAAVIGAAHAAKLPSALDDETVTALSNLAPLGERKYTPSAKADKRLALARDTLRAPGGEVEAPCLSSRGDICVTRALDGFFHDLDSLDRSASGADHVIISTWGNSLIAADGIVDVVRQRLQDRFGDGGRGYLLVDRISEGALRARTGKGDGWLPYNLGQGERGRHALGVSGANHVSARRGAYSSFRVRGETRARVFFLGHARSPGFVLMADGEEIGRREAAAAEGAQFFDVAIPPKTKQLRLKALGSGLVVQGVVLERDTPGVQLDTHGLPASDSVRWLTADEDVVRSQLTARAPSLNLVMLGGVENRRVAWGRYSEDKVDQSLRGLLARAKAGAPGASCLVVGPVDAVEGMLDEKVRGRAVTPFRERPTLRRVNARYRRAALDAGCGFFDLFAAMGGSGTLRRMDRHGWLLEDHVHPRGFGLDSAGELIADGLMRAWATTPRGLDPAMRRALALLTSPIAPDAAASDIRALADGDERQSVLSLTGDDALALAPRVEARLASVLGAPRDGLLAPTARIGRLGATVEAMPPGADAHLDTSALLALVPDQPQFAADALALDLLARSIGR